MNDRRYASNRQVRLPITTELLHAILDLPADVRIIGTAWSPNEPRYVETEIELWLEGDRFPEGGGDHPPVVTPTLTVDKQRDGVRMNHETLVVKETDDG